MVGRVGEVVARVISEDHVRRGVVHLSRELGGGKGSQHPLPVEARDEDGRAPRVLALLLNPAVASPLLTRGILRLLLRLGGIVVRGNLVAQILDLLREAVDPRLGSGLRAPRHHRGSISSHPGSLGCDEPREPSDRTRATATARQILLGGKFVASENHRPGFSC